MGREGTPLFEGIQKPDGEIYFSYEVSHRIMDWFNGHPIPEEAYYAKDCFVFPTEHGEWEEFIVDQDGDYPINIGLIPQPVCWKCLNYPPCDCKFKLLSAENLTKLEETALLREKFMLSDVRNLCYTIRELQK